MGLSLLLPPSCETLEIPLSWGDYEELYEETTRELWEQDKARHRGGGAGPSRAWWPSPVGVTHPSAEVPGGTGVQPVLGRMDDRSKVRDHAEWAVGHGVATDALVEDGECRALATTWVPRAAVYRMEATSVGGVLLAVDELAALPDPLARSATAWRRSSPTTSDEGRQQTARELLQEARRRSAAWDEGIAALARVPKLVAASLAMM